jgi:hypothetical protein
MASRANEWHRSRVWQAEQVAALELSKQESGFKSSSE